MKSKGGASLYEVLKSASRPSADPAPSPAPGEAPPPSSQPQPSLKDRLAAYKAQKLAEAQSPVGSATAVAEATPVPVAVAEATPPPAPVSPLRTPVAVEHEPRPAAGPGERVLRLTYNTAAFAALVVLGLLFVAYAIGVKAGKSRAVEAVVEPVADRAPAPPAPLPTAVPPGPPKSYTIHLVEWPTRRSEERLKAAEAADTYKKALERKGIRNVEALKIMRGGEERLALYVDRFKDVTSEPAKARIVELQKFKVGNLTPFTQASFEEVPR